jgi:hypothetical protein
MKKNIDFPIIFSFVFLFLGTSCQDETYHDPLDKFSVTDITWYLSQNSISQSYQDFSLHINPQIVRFSLTSDSLAETNNFSSDSHPTPETDDRILNLEITANRDYYPKFTQGENLTDLFEVEVRYSHTGTQKTYSLSDFLNSNPRFPDSMILRLKEAPSSSGNFAFTVKFEIDGSELQYYEFNTGSVELQL